VSKLVFIFTIVGTNRYDREEWSIIDSYIKEPSRIPYYVGRAQSVFDDVTKLYVSTYAGDPITKKIECVYYNERELLVREELNIKAKELKNKKKSLSSETLASFIASNPAPPQVNSAAWVDNPWGGVPQAVPQIMDDVEHMEDDEPPEELFQLPLTHAQLVEATNSYSQLTHEFDNYLMSCDDNGVASLPFTQWYWQIHVN